MKETYSQIDEEAVLASILMSGEVATDALDQLRPEDFYQVDTRLIFNAIVDLAVEGVEINPPSVGAKLEKMGKLNEIGGAGRLMVLMDRSMEAQSPKFHMENLRHYSTFRQLIEKLTILLQDAKAQDESAETVLEKAERFIYEIASRKSEGETNMNKALLDYIDSLEKRFKEGAGVLGVSTGFPSIDRVTAGLRKGNLIILAARPSIGKTSLALDFCRNMILRGESVAFFALEQTQDEIFNRLLSAMSRIPAFDLQMGKIGNQWDKLRTCVEKLADGVLNLDCTLADTALAIKSRSRKIATRLSRQDKKLSLIVIDYLQLMGGDSRNSESRQNEVSQISRSLKKMAIELDVPVLALSQLNRKPEERKDGVPIMSDLRESGSLEQDADLVMMLWRESDRTKLAIKKHRNGPCVDFSLFFDKEHSSFKEMEETQEEKNERYGN